MPTLLVFADDWGRHPSSCQHLVDRLLGRYEVIWVNTIGMRAPQLDMATLARGIEKIRHWHARSHERARHRPRLHVVNPRMWPWFRSVADRAFNRGLLTRALAPLLGELPTPPVAVSTIPIVSDLIGTLAVDRWVYYCVDDFAQWPGLDQEPMRLMEERLVERADIVIAAGTSLAARLAGMGRTAPVLTHGVDLERWQYGGGKVPPELSGLKRPLVVFWGSVDRRMDWQFVRQLGEDLTEGTIVFAGPGPDPRNALDGLSRVVYLGCLDFEALPALAQEAAVLVMPYDDLPVTRAMQPLKLKEYLATSRPAVARDLPSTRPWADCLDLVETPRAFSEAVSLRLSTGLPANQCLARRRLEGESWAAKARLFERMAGLPGLEPESV